MEGIFFSCSLFLFVVRRVPHFVVLKLLKSQLLARCTFNNCQQLHPVKSRCLPTRVLAQISTRLLVFN